MHRKITTGELNTLAKEDVGKKLSAEELVEKCNVLNRISMQNMVIGEVITMEKYQFVQNALIASICTDVLDILVGMKK